MCRSNNTLGTPSFMKPLPADSTSEIVLMDALMPRMDGFEAARLIKQLAGEELVPIIFLTSLTDAESLVKCLDAGGDDFLSKPYNRVILQAKINAFNRMRVMHSTVQLQRDHIAENNEHLLQEQQVAKTVFDNVAHLGCLNAKILSIYYPLCLSLMAMFYWPAKNLLAECTCCWETSPGMGYLQPLVRCQ